MDKKNFSPSVASIIFSLYPSDKSLSKRWFISCKAPKLRKFYFPTTLKTVAERLAYLPTLQNKALTILESEYQEEQRKRAAKPNYEKVSIYDLLMSALDKRSPDLDRISIKGYKSKIKKFCSFLYKGGLKNSKVTQAHVVAFFAEEKKAGISSTTINNYTVALRSFFEDLKKSGDVLLNPFDNIKKYKESRRGYNYFKAGEIKDLRTYMQAHEPQLWLACKMMYYCYLRPKKELRLLKVGDIDLIERRILVRGDNAKNDQFQYVNIPDALLPDLVGLNLSSYPRYFYLFGKDSGGSPGRHHWGINYFRLVHQEVLKVLGFDLSFHKFYSWKYTGIVWAAKSGIPLHEIQKQARHHSLEQIQIYLRSQGVLDCEHIQHNFPDISRFGETAKKEGALPKLSAMGVLLQNTPKESLQTVFSRCFDLYRKEHGDDFEGLYLLRRMYETLEAAKVGE